MYISLYKPNQLQKKQINAEVTDLWLANINAELTDAVGEFIAHGPAEKCTTPSSAHPAPSSANLGHRGRCSSRSPSGSKMFFKAFGFFSSLACTAFPGHLMGLQAVSVKTDG